MDPTTRSCSNRSRIGPKTLRNRFYQVPHCSGFGTEKPWTQAAHRGVKAEGGWAAVSTEYAPFSPDSDEAPLIAARFWDEDDMRALRLMTEAAHEHGALAGLELHHTGATRRTPRHASPRSHRASSHPISSPTSCRRRWRRPTSIAWWTAGRRPPSGRATAGRHVYVYGAHWYLPMQFLSPFYNKRTDAYGGALKDRARFWLETLEAVRDAVGDGLRRGHADRGRRPRPRRDPPGGGAVRSWRLADDLVDFWDVNVGSIAYWSKDSGTSRYFEEGYQLEWTGGFDRRPPSPSSGWDA